MEGMTDEEGLNYAVDPFCDQFLPVMNSWADAAGNDNVRIVQFEHLVSSGGFEEWRSIMKHFDFRLSDNQLRSVLSTYALKNLQGSTKKGQLDKYSAGAKRNWRDLLVGPTRDLFSQKVGTVLRRFGYE